MSWQALGLCNLCYLISSEGCKGGQRFELSAFREGKVSDEGVVDIIGSNIPEDLKVYAHGYFFWIHNRDGKAYER